MLKRLDAESAEDRRTRREISALSAHTLRPLRNVFVLLLLAPLSAAQEKIHFTDVTKTAGINFIHNNGAFGKKYLPETLGPGAAFIDYDKDGRLDLLVGNYVQWSPETDLYCTLDGVHKSYCTPESYKGASARLWHNLGNGRFEDVTQKAGLQDPSAKTLGLAILDYNSDGWPDLLLANDTQPNKLYRNLGNGSFREDGVAAGITFSEDGIARAGMGVDAGDYDGSGRASIIISNFSNQMMALYHNEGNGLFVDEAPASSLGRDTLLSLGFACFFFDYDLDGWLDILMANGHIDADIERIQKRVTFAQPPHLFRNLGNGKFTEVTGSMGAAFKRPRVARGAAYADIDNDGDLDLLITTNAGPSVLLRNDGGSNNSLRVRLVGTRSNRDGIGAVVVATVGGHKDTRMLRSGSSYLSQSELVLTFGLGKQKKVDVVEIRC